MGAAPWDPVAPQRGGTGTPLPWDRDTLLASWGGRWSRAPQGSPQPCPQLLPQPGVPGLPGRTRTVRVVHAVPAVRAVHGVRASGTPQPSRPSDG